jgi:hypothetical protein
MSTHSRSALGWSHKQVSVRLSSHRCVRAGSLCWLLLSGCRRFDRASRHHAARANAARSDSMRKRERTTRADNERVKNAARAAVEKGKKPLGADPTNDSDGGAIASRTRTRATTAAQDASEEPRRQPRHRAAKAAAQADTVEEGASKKPRQADPANQQPGGRKRRAEKTTGRKADPKRGRAAGTGAHLAVRAATNPAWMHYVITSLRVSCVRR